MKTKGTQIRKGFQLPIKLSKSTTLNREKMFTRLKKKMPSYVHVQYLGSNRLQVTCVGHAYDTHYGKKKSFHRHVEQVLDGTGWEIKGTRPSGIAVIGRMSEK